MRRTAFASAAIIGLTVMLAACGGAEGATDEEQMDSGSSEQMSDGGMEDGAAEDGAMDDESMGEGEDEPMGEARSGALEGEGSMVSGSVTVADGAVDLTDFSADGDGLHLYLAEGADQMAVEAGLDLGALEQEADQSFDAMGDTADYTHVVVYAPMDQTVVAAAELM